MAVLDTYACSLEDADAEPIWMALLDIARSIKSTENIILFTDRLSLSIPKNRIDESIKLRETISLEFPIAGKFLSYDLACDLIKVGRSDDAKELMLVYLGISQKDCEELVEEFLKDEGFLTDEGVWSDRKSIIDYALEDEDLLPIQEFLKEIKNQENLDNNEPNTVFEETITIESREIEGPTLNINIGSHGSHNIPMERAALISVQNPKTKEYLVPNLKPDKLAKAINHYAPSVNVADVLLHADTTFWGSAKDGFILTYSHLYASSDKLKIKVLPVTDISKIEYTNNDSTVYVNGEAFFHCKAGSFSSPAVIVPIIDAVRFILKLDN